MNMQPQSGSQGPARTDRSSGTGFGNTDILRPRTSHHKPAPDTITALTQKKVLPASEKKNYPVLVVDGNGDTRTTVSEFMDADGYTPKMACNVMEAAEICRAEGILVLVLDVDTAFNNKGVHDVNDLRSNISALKEASPGVRILALATEFGSGIESMLLEAGADKAIEKNSFNELMPSIDALMPVCFEAAETTVDKKDTLAPEKAVAKKHCSILHVDDEERIKEIVAGYLEEYDVTPAGNGTEGVAAYKKAWDAGTPYDVVISDRQMPQMNGATMFGELKKINPDVKLIFITGMAVAADIEALRALNPVEVLEKPLNGILLKNAVNVALSQMNG